VFFVWPVIDMASRAFTEPTVGFDNFVLLGRNPVIFGSLILTLQTAALVTLVCLVLGYPLAYLLVHVSGRVAAVLLGLVLVSLWLNLVARTFSWQILLRDTGVINKFLIDIGVIDEPLSLIRTPLAVMIGMSHILLPTMVLPLYVVMRRIDAEYGRAAASLGASPVRSFISVFLPLSLSGVLTGCLLVFVLAVGFYITPFLLGGGRFLLVGQLVVDQVLQLRWGPASAIALLLLTVTVACLGVAARAIRIGDVFGFADGEP
jgi:ABC-type spermidine/putrescine transport system permease subunit I